MLVFVVVGGVVVVVVMVVVAAAVAVAVVAGAVVVVVKVHRVAGFGYSHFPAPCKATAEEVDRKDHVSEEAFLRNR